MNIFFLHTNPRKCARWHCDKHVVKMLLETCQLLYTCHWIVTFDKPNFETAPYKKGSLQKGYKKAHWNHPCSKWVRLSLFNYIWLATLGIELLREYEFRYEKTHMCGEHIKWLYANMPCGLNNIGWIEPHLAMPDEYKSGDAVTSYRKYYIGAKKEFLTYKKRHVPHWIA